MAGNWKWVAVVAVGVGAALTVLLGVLVGSIAVLLFVFSWDDVRTALAGRASGVAGREVTIEGDFAVLDWSFTPRIRIERIRVANEDWSNEPVMTSIERLEFAIRIPELLRGRTVLTDLVLDRPQFLLEKNGDGDANWHLGDRPAAGVAVEAAVPEERTEFPVIERLSIRDGVIVYRDPSRDIDVRSLVNTAAGEAGAEESVELTGEGTFEGKSFKLRLAGGSILELREAGQPYPVLMDASVGATKARIEGTMVEPLDVSGLDLKLDISGPDLAEVFPIFGIPLPPSPPYSLSGRLERRGAVWSFQDFAGKVGDSDMSGDLSVDTAPERPFMKAQLVSQKLDFDDLGGLVGAPPNTEETASAEQQEQAAEMEAKGRVLPDMQVDLERLRAMDMDVTFTGKQVLAPDLPLEDFEARFLLENGRLVVDPVSFGLAGGALGGRVILNGRQDVPSVATALEISRVQLKPFFAGTDFADEMAGVFGGRIELEGNGRSLAEILAASDGELAVVMADGQFSNLLLELVGIDVAEALGFLVTEDEPVRIRCVVADFGVEKGIGKSRTFVIDTTDTNVTGEAAIDLGKELLAVRLLAHPKDPSLLAARSPVIVDGSFAEPEFGVDPTGVIARGAAAAALGALLTPLAALLPMIELGLGEDSPCAQLIERAKQSSG